MNCRAWVGGPGLRLGLCLVLATSGAAAATGGPVVEEYALKAAVVLNLAKFVEWPQGTFLNPQDPIVICILGDNPFGRSLEQAVRGQAIDNRPLIVQQVSNVAQARSCQVVFVSWSERKRLRSIFGQLSSRGILTVGDTDDFAAEGGVVNLSVEANRIRIEINPEAAGQQRMRISSRLLSLALIKRTLRAKK
ncbi:MAG TPA: YfiR family protein [Bryobacteraceae bacterium]|nr:YfiR family protein [Bryobacteraceae bacterium]